MNDHISLRERRRELLITTAYTFFSVLMIIVTQSEAWPLFYIPLIAAELAFVWWSYVVKFQSYSFRAAIVTMATCLNIFLYGIQGENFMVLIPTICTQFVLLSLYEIVRIMDIVVAETVILFIYHATVNSETLIPDTKLEKSRMMLQLLSLVALIILCIYRIRHHVQEEEDTILLEQRVNKEMKIKDDFVANTSHELRTPVNTISGMCEILLQKPLTDDVHRNVVDIQMTSVELQNIISDVMDYSALESGTLLLSPREYNITSTINDVMNTMVFENSEKNLEVLFDCDPNIPCLLEGDEQQLRRILSSLISNAIKFTTEGGVIVSVTYRKERYGINLIISVRDTGIGLTLEEQEQILRGFYQQDSDRNRKSTGMGLGLTISSSLIKIMGGFMTIKSKPGYGSEFTFSIPQKVVKSDPCISLQHPGTIKMVWYYNSRSDNALMRDALAEQINHFADYFGVASQRASTLEEVKRIASKEWGIYLVLGKDEYMQDKEYFDALAGMITIVLILDYADTVNVASKIHVLHKPYNSIMLAEILNGREQPTTARRKKQKEFVAPTAKILVVDDNLMNLKVVEGLLRKYRIKIVTATSGEEALNLIDSRDYDFVFMDHMMPGMDGVECFHHIRSKPGVYFAQVPIIALTANAIAGSREMFLNEGFNEFVAKPIDTALLNDVLQRFIPMDKQIQDTSADAEPQEPEETKDAVETAETKETKETKASRKETLIASPHEVEESTDDEELKGIDMEAAILYCGSIEDFKELAEVYCKSGKKYVEDLKTAYDAKDWKNYSILAHTIKSTSKTLGANELSELAFTQEMAGKEENEDIIMMHHDAFSKEYDRMLKMLNKYLKGGSAEPKLKKSKDEAKSDDSKKKAKAKADAKAKAAATTRTRDVDDWNAIRSELIECLEKFETRAFTECLDKYHERTLNGKPLADVLSGVERKAQAFDFEGAIAELNVIGGDA